MDLVAASGAVRCGAASLSQTAASDLAADNHLHHDCYGRIVDAIVADSDTSFQRCVHSEWLLAVREHTDN